MRERWASLDTELQAIRSEVIAVRDARINRADIAILVDQWIARTAAGFEEAVAARASRQLGGSGTAATFNVGFLGLGSADPDSPGVKAMDGVMCAVFGSQIRNHIVAAVERMDWPDEGLRTAERTKKLALLAEREKTVRQDLEKIIKDAADAGIDL